MCPRVLMSGRRMRSYSYPYTWMARRRLPDSNRLSNTSVWSSSSSGRYTGGRSVTPVYRRLAASRGADVEAS